MYYAKFTVSLAILHVSCKINSPFRPPDIRPIRVDNYEFVMLLTASGYVVGNEGATGIARGGCC